MLEINVFDGKEFSRLAFGKFMVMKCFEGFWDEWLVRKYFIKFLKISKLIVFFSVAEILPWTGREF